MGNEYDLDAIVYENYDTKGISPYELLQQMNSWNKEVRITVSDGFNQVESQLKVVSDSITLKVSSSDIINAINLSKEGIKILASRLDISGLVTISALSTPGMTLIHGGNIATGTILADRLYVTELSTLSADLGTIRAGIINGIQINGANISIMEDITVGKYINIGKGIGAARKGIKFVGTTSSIEAYGDAMDIASSFINLIGRVDFSSATVTGLTVPYATNSGTVGGLSSSAFPHLAGHQYGASVSFSGTGDMTWVVNGSSFTYRKV